MKQINMVLTAIIVLGIIAIIATTIIQTTNTSGYFGQITNTTSSDEIKIGIITPLSGELANYGTATKNAAMLAEKEINETGGINGKKIVLTVEDSPCSAEKAVTALTKLIELDKAQLILGPLCSSELLAMAPTIEKTQTTLISSSATSPNVTNAGDYVFRDTPSDDLRAILFSEYIYKEAKVEQLAIIHPIDDASSAYVKFFTENYKKLGGEVLAVESYTKGAKDVRTQLLKIKNSGAKAVFMPNWPEEAAHILIQSKELGLNANFFEGFEVVDDPQLKEIAGDLVNGIIYIRPSVATNPETKIFKEKYLAEYGVEAPYYSAEAYDAIMLFAKAIETTSGDLSKVKNELYKIKNYPGASGNITFDEHGDVLKPFEIGEVIDGNLVTIKIVE